jgi:hypothetical protein
VAQFGAAQGGAATITLPVTFALMPGHPRPVPRPQPVDVRPTPLPADVAVHRPGDDSWLGQGQPAFDKLQTELAASPTSRKRHEAVVRTLLLRGRFAPALTAAQKFVELDPDLPIARELLAYAAVATGDRNLAVASVDALTESAPCPYAIVITPTGTVFSPWTPALGRSSATSFAFSGLMTGVYHVLLIGGAPDAKGQLEVRALAAQRSLPFSAGHARTIVTTQVTMAPPPGNILGRRRAL